MKLGEFGCILHPVCTSKSLPNAASLYLSSAFTEKGRLTTLRLQEEIFSPKGGRELSVSPRLGWPLHGGRDPESVKKNLLLRSTHSAADL